MIFSQEKTSIVFVNRIVAQTEQKIKPFLHLAGGSSDGECRLGQNIYKYKIATALLTYR